MDHADYLNLISKRDRSIAASAMRICLRVGSWAYGGAVRVRNELFGARVRRVHRAGVPLISIGNLTTGGTGKTPVVAWIVSRLSAVGQRPGIVSRGYRSLELGKNDEQLVLELLCPGVPHVQNRDRVAAAAELLKRHPANVLVADDAFQHRRLHRDLDIVLIDALNPWGFGYLLPRGLLREPHSGLRRADLVILTRADQIGATARQSLWHEIRRWKPDVAEVEIAFEPRGFRRSDGQVSRSVSGPVVAFCGIGNPEGFRRTVNQAGIQVAGWKEFPDHHHYGPPDHAALAMLAHDTTAAAFVTTLKDLVKFDTNEIDGLPLWAVEIQATVLKGADVLESALRNVCRRSGA